MENMSSGIKREVLPKYAVRYRKRAIGVNSFMDSWKKVRETASCQSIRNELPVAGHVGGRFSVCPEQICKYKKVY